MSGLINFLIMGGTTPPIIIPIENSVFVFDGNSLTAGQGGTPYPTQFSQLDGIVGKGCTFHNLGVGAQQTSQMIADFNSQVLPLYDPNKSCFYLVNEVGNDIYYNGDVSEAMSRFWQLCDMAKNAGFIVGVIGLEDRSWSYLEYITAYGELTPAGDNDIQFRQKLADCRVNTVANWSTHGNFYVDLMATTELSNCFNLTYFTDYIHNTTAGYGVWAREVRNSTLNYCNIPL